MNTIFQREEIDSHVYSLTHYFDTKECYPIVEAASTEYWKSAPKSDGKENYVFGPDATFRSLGTMLLNGKFDCGFTVLEMDGKPWAFGGIRRFDDETTLILGRHFSFFTVKPITLGLLLPLHLSVSKQLGYKKAWITINDYNIHLRRAYQINVFNRRKSSKRLNKLYTNSDQCISVCRDIGKMTIYKTEQSVLEWIL